MAAAGGEQEDPELLARIGVVREGIYRRMKLLASWADLDDDKVSNSKYLSLSTLSSLLTLLSLYISLSLSTSLSILLSIHLSIYLSIFPSAAAAGA